MQRVHLYNHHISLSLSLSLSRSLSFSLLSSSWLYIRCFIYILCIYILNWYKTLTISLKVTFFKSAILLIIRDENDNNNNFGLHSSFVIFYLAVKYNQIQENRMHDHSLIFTYQIAIFELYFRILLKHSNLIIFLLFNSTD